MAMRSVRLLVASVLAVLPVAAGAQDYGADEYVNSCSGCHGLSGRGDGPLAADLQAPPADLTVLSEQNGGAFPYWKVYSVIDGRYVVPGHGERDMPVWGRMFLPGDTADYGEAGGEAVTQARIRALTDYVQSLQR